MRLPPATSPLGSWLRLLQSPLYIMPEPSQRIGCATGRVPIPPDSMPLLCRVGISLPDWWNDKANPAFCSWVSSSLDPPRTEPGISGIARLVLWGRQGRPGSGCIVVGSHPLGPAIAFPLHVPIPVASHHEWARAKRSLPSRLLRSPDDAVLVMHNAAVESVTLPGRDASGYVPRMAVLWPCALVPLRWWLAASPHGLRIASPWIAFLAGVESAHRYPRATEEAVALGEAAALRAASLPSSVSLGSEVLRSMRARARGGFKLRRASGDGGAMVRGAADNGSAVSPPG